MASTKAKSHKDLAFNLSLAAYDFDYPERVPNQRLAVKELLEDPAGTAHHVLAMKPSNVAKLLPTQAELAFNEDSITGIWVGMWLTTAPNLNNLKRMTISNVEQYTGQLLIKRKSNALRVIAITGNSSPRYFCLLSPKDGLCTAHSISVEEVFFFEEYRDDTASPLEARRQTWNNKVRDACKQGEEILISDSDEPLAQRVSGSVQKTSANKEKSDSVVETSSSITSKTASVAVEERTAMYRLATSNKVLDLQQCEQAIQEIYEFAPTMEKEALQPSEIQSVSEGLVQAKIVLDFRLLHDFIILFIDHLRASSDESKEALAILSRDRAQRFYAWAVGRKTINPDPFNRYLSTEIKKHREFLASTELYATHALRADQHGIARYLRAEVVGLEEHIQRLEELHGTLPETQAERNSRRPRFMEL